MDLIRLRAVANLSLVTAWAVGTTTEAGIRGGFLEDGKGKPGFAPGGKRPLVNRFRRGWFGLNNKKTEKC